MEYKEEDKKLDNDKIYENYLNMIKGLPTKQRDDIENEKRDRIERLLTTQEFAHKEFTDKYMKWKVTSGSTQIDEAEQETNRSFEEMPLNF